MLARARLGVLLAASLLASPLVTGALFPQEAHAQLRSAPVDLQIFRPAMDSKGFFTLNTSQVLGSGDFSFGLVSSWGSGVLKLENPGITAGGSPAQFKVQNIVTPSLQAAIGITSYAHFGFELGQYRRLPD